MAIPSDDGQAWMGWFTAALLNVESHGTLRRFKNILKDKLKINPP
jgi:hypothetical protein